MSNGLFLEKLGGYGVHFRFLSNFTLGIFIERVAIATIKGDFSQRYYFLVLLKFLW
jgi:hypothetical protein